MAAPTIVGSPVATNETGFVTSYTVTLPASPTTGNLLVAFCSTGTEDASGSLFTIPAGTGTWTEIAEVGNGGANKCECTLVGYWKEVEGDEDATYEIVTTATGTPGNTVCVEINGANNSAPINQSPVTSETEGGSIAQHDALGVTTDVDDCYVLAAFVLDGGDAGTSTIGGTGWAKIADETSGPDNFDNVLVVADKTMSGQGATGTCECTPTTSSEGARMQVAIEPVGITDTTIEVPIGPVW